MALQQWQSVSCRKLGQSQPGEGLFQEEAQDPDRLHEPLSLLQLIELSVPMMFAIQFYFLRMHLEKRYQTFCQSFDQDCEKWLPE